MTLTPSRRTVVRAAAWTAPAVVVVAAVPANAASVAAPTTFRINTSPAPSYGEPSRNLNVGASNPTRDPLVVTFEFPLTGADPYVVTLMSNTWDLGYVDSKQAFVLSTTVAPLSDSRTFNAGWSSGTPTAKNVTLIATAPGMDTAVAVVSLPFDQPAI